MIKIRTGLTYNDVLLVPKKTPLNSRNQADLKTKFTRNIKLNNPLVSANMSTVTEHKMAIAMARMGGLGVIHQFGSIEDQVNEVKKVKRSTSYVVEDPVTVSKDITFKESLDIMNEYGITSLLIEENEDLIGIFTYRDYCFEKNLNKKISELMTPKDKLITAAYGITLEEAKQKLNYHKIEKLPLLKYGKIKGLITSKDIEQLEFWKHASRDSKGRLMVGAAVGVKDTLQRAKALVDAGVDVLVLDIAHCHSDYAIERLKELKENFDIDVMAGNIATKEAARDLIEAGADGLKVGIGPSPVCTTRIMSGAGVPQLTAVMDVCEIASKNFIPVCADGGLKFPGDVCKALAAGASTIFSGTLFAGTTESPGIIVTKEGKRYKRYMGSASYESGHERKEKIFGKKIKENVDVYVEGVSVLVNYQGSVQGVIKGLIKGIKSGLSYCGAHNILEMQENAEFIQITSSAWEESKSRGTKLFE